MWFFLPLLIFIAIFGFKQIKDQIAVIRWKRTLNLNKQADIFNKLYANIDGFTLSRQARDGYDAIEYLYGEIKFEHFIALLSLCRPNSSTVFYDLGSGTGKAVLACSMVFKVKKSLGVELFDSLHQVAISQKMHLREIKDYELQADTIQFINGDFIQTDLTEATIVFINSTAFIGETWHKISQHLHQLKSGTLVISTSKPLPASSFIMQHITLVAMSWGVVKAFIQQRI
ncbi:MAG: hypothetical protein H0U70_06855 [Tatlockia sp.]|nr:hypothetical protein [Tatlockia sp.]